MTRLKREAVDGGITLREHCIWRLSDEAVSEVPIPTPTQVQKTAARKKGAAVVDACGETFQVAWPCVLLNGHAGDHVPLGVDLRSDDEAGLPATTEGGGEVAGTYGGITRGPGPGVAKPIERVAAALNDKNWSPNAKCRHGYMNSFVCEKANGGCGR